MANVVASPSEAFHTNISETHLRRVAWRSSSSYAIFTWVQYIIPESFQVGVGECCRASVNFLLPLYFYKILIDCPPLPLGPRIARAMQSVVVILPQLTAVAGGTSHPPSPHQPKSFLLLPSQPPFDLDSKQYMLISKFKSENIFMAAVSCLYLFCSKKCFSPGPSTWRDQHLPDIKTESFLTLFSDHSFLLILYQIMLKK